MKPKRFLTVAGKGATHAVLMATALIMLLPFVWMLLSSFKEPDDVFTYSMRWLPSKVTLSGYVRAVTKHPFWRYTANSLIISFSVTSMQLITSALAGYAFARLEFPGRDVLFMIYLAAMMIPHQAMVIPSFILMKKLGLLDTFAALILPFAAGPFGAFLMRQFFLSMPKSLEEAAIIDGCSRIGVLWKIILPLSKPALSTLALFVFMNSWNDFMWPLIITNRVEMRTLQVGLSLMRSDVHPDWPMLMAATVLATMPVLVAFLSAQKQFIESLAFTGVKY